MRTAHRTLMLALGLFGSAGNALAASAPTAIAHPAVLSPDEVWAKLTIGNRRFVQGRPMHHELVDARGALAVAQNPWVIVLGCADSRVSPELVFDQSLGDMFVIRTVGHVADPIALGSIEYAIEQLHPSALVILGHENCGAVTAAASGQKMPTANLDAIVRKIRPALADLRGAVTGDDLIRRGVDANVQYCAHDLVKESPIVRKYVEEELLTIVKAVYDLDTGEVARLE